MKLKSLAGVCGMYFWEIKTKYIIFIEINGVSIVVLLDNATLPNTICQHYLTRCTKHFTIRMTDF